MSETKSPKYEKPESLHYLSGTISILGGTQHPNRWHHHDQHGKEGPIECLFDLECHTCQDNGATRDERSKESSNLEILLFFVD